jgi:hypothetical protein
VQNLYGAIEYLKSEGIPHQLLFNKMTFNPAKAGREYIESIKASHNRYEEATGLKVQLGEVKEGINFYCIDIDCKGIPEEGKAAFDNLIRQFPQLGNTYIEKTKSQGYHIFFYTDLKNTASKIVFSYPFGIEVKPGGKLEIEVFLKDLVTIAPTKTIKGNYTALNDNRISFFRAEEVQNFFKFLKENSVNYEIVQGSKNSGDPREYRGEEVTGEALNLLTSILELNGLSYDFKGNKIRVYGYNDGKNPDYRINYFNDNFYLWNVKDQNAKKPTLREYIEQHQKYIPSPLEKIEILRRDKIIKVKKYLSESQELKEVIQRDTNTLIIAPCGTGKTYTSINSIKANNEKFIFAVPNKVVKEQVGREYDLSIAGGDCHPTLKEALNKGHTQIIACYEALTQSSFDTSLLRDFVLVIDEAHSLLLELHYRNNLRLLELQKNAKRTLWLTATPQAIIKTFNKVVEVKSEHKINASITVLKSDNKRISKGQYARFLQTFLSISKGPTLLVFSKEIDSMKVITGQEVIHSKEAKKIKSYNEILGGFLPDGFTASTNLFNAGHSFYNKGVVNLIIDFRDYLVNEANFIQLINRFRVAEKVNVIIIKRNTKQFKAKESTVKGEALKLIEKVNTDKVKLLQVYGLNNPFKYCIDLDNTTGKLRLLETMLPATEFLINGAKNTSSEIAEKIARENDWEYKGELSLSEYEDETLTVKKGKKTKTLLSELFLTDGKINKFASRYFTYMLTSNEYNRSWYEREHPQETAILKAIMTDNRVKQALKELVSRIHDLNNIEKELKRYFKITNKYDDIIQLTPENKQALKEKVLSLGVDTQRFTKTRKILAEHIEAFIPDPTITGNNQVKELLKWLEVSHKRDKNKSKIYLF